MFEKDLPNGRIRVFFGQEEEGVRHSTFISITDREGRVKKQKVLLEMSKIEHSPRCEEYKFSGKTTQN